MCDRSVMANPLQRSRGLQRYAPFGLTLGCIGPRVTCADGRAGNVVVEDGGRDGDSNVPLQDVTRIEVCRAGS